MKSRPVLSRWVFAAAFASLIGGAEASSNKIALVPGGPHPYFAPWEQAAADAKKDLVPSDWKLNLRRSCSKA
jgi:ribose transport system substrate-binding protein